MRRKGADPRRYLFRSGREPDTRNLLLVIVTNDSAVLARRAGHRPPIPRRLFHIAHDRTLRRIAERDNVADLELGWMHQGRINCH